MWGVKYGKKGFNNLSDMCWIFEITSPWFWNLLLLPSQYVEEDFVVSHKKAFQKRKRKKKGLKGGKDTEEKGGSFYINIPSLSLQYISSIFRVKLVVLG